MPPDRKIRMIRRYKDQITDCAGYVSCFIPDKTPAEDILRIVRLLPDKHFKVGQGL